jgi:hypothetical protein
MCDTSTNVSRQTKKQKTFLELKEEEKMAFCLYFYSLSREGLGSWKPRDKKGFFLTVSFHRKSAEGKRYKKRRGTL